MQEDQDNWCASAMRLVGAGCAKVLFYAYVIDPSMCARTLVSERRVYRHGSDRNAMVMCIEMTTTDAPSQKRMFMRCFSCKCKQQRIPLARQAARFETSSSWVEILESDLDSYAVSIAVSSPPLSSSAAEVEKEEDPPSLRVEFAYAWNSIHKRYRDRILAELGVLNTDREEDHRQGFVNVKRTAGPQAYAMLATERACAVVCCSDIQLFSTRIQCPRRRHLHSSIHSQKEEKEGAKSESGSATTDLAQNFAGQKDDNDETLVMILQRIEKCSGAYGYSLFIGCKCKQCRTTFAELWLMVPF